MFHPATTALCLIAALSVGGCQFASPSSPTTSASDGENSAAQIADLQRQVASQQDEIQRLSEQLEGLRGFGQDRLDNLVQVETIAFGRFTRGYDDNDDGRDDGVTVYLILRDRQRDVVKAAGQVRIELWDLAQPAGKRELARREFDLKTLPKHWLGGLGANHFKFQIPWPEKDPPAHPHLTLKLTFTSALTGRPFEIQKLLSVVF